MIPQLEIIRTNEQLRAFNGVLKGIAPEYVAYDIETTGVHKGAEVVGISICWREEKAYYIVLKEWKNNELVDVITDNATFIEVLSWLKYYCKLIMHNAIFDCSQTNDSFKVSLIESLHTDTMVLAHLLNENRRVGLKELAREYFGEDAAKEQQEMKASVIANGGIWSEGKDSIKEMYKADSEILGKYGAKDAYLTLMLFYQLVPELVDQGLYDFFYTDESMPLLKGPTYQLNTTGLKVDQEQLLSLKKTLQAECEEAKAFIYKEIHAKVKDKYPGTNKKNTFSIGSNQQLSWLLFGVYELEFGTLTDTGKKICKFLGFKLPYTIGAKRDFIHYCVNSKDVPYELEAVVNGKTKKPKKIKDPWAYIACDKKVLKKIAPKLKWVEKLLEYKSKMKLLSTYVEGIEKRIQYGIIRPSFLQHGTTSGRYASRNPNFQNLPRDDKRIKACIVARPGSVFVGADHSQLEPRTFAYLSGDPRLLQAFDGSSDFYSVIGMEVYQKSDCTPQKEGSVDAFGVKYKKLRDLSKVIALASTYGATAHQLAPTTGKSIEDTQQDIDNYFETFPDVKEFMLKSHEIAKKHGYVENIFGRKRRMPEAKKFTKIYGNASHGELPYEARNVLNLAVNHRVQSTGASIVNRNAIKFLENCRLAGIEDVKLILQVHDSLIAECKEKDAEVVGLLLQDAMETAVTLKGVSFEAVPKIGKTLAEV